MDLTARFHWLAFTSRIEADPLFGALSKAVYDVPYSDARSVFFETGYGGNGYKSVLLGPYGVKVYFSPSRDDVHVVIPGGACDVAPVSALLDLFSLPSTTFTRIDAALDGVERDGRPLSPVWLYDRAIDDPDSFRTRVRLRAEPDEETGKYPESVRLSRSRNGDTFYLGATSSECMMRAYNSRGFTRMELQYRGEKAKALRDLFEGSGSEKLSSSIVGLIRSHVDFIDGSTSRGHRSEAPLQSWWQAVVQDADKIGLYVPRVDPQLDKSFRFFRKQWAAFIRTCLEASGGDMDFLTQLAEEGSRKLTAKHHRMIREAGGPGGWTPDFSN